MNPIPQFIRKALSHRAVDGIRVAGRGKDLLTLERRVGPNTEMRAVPVSAGVRVACSLDGQRSALNVAFEDGTTWTFEPGSEQLCRENYEALMRTVAKKPRSVWLTAAVSVVAAFTIVMLVPVGGGVVAATAPTSDTAPPPSLFNDSLPPQGSTLSETEMVQVKQADGIAMKAKGDTFYVFSDPNCPFCVELERSLAKLDGDLQPVVIPLGYKPGSRDLAAAVLCSENPAKAWRSALIEGVAPKAGACEKGLQAVDSNMALFHRLQMSSTPTMVSAKGSVIVGSGNPETIKLALSQ